MSTTEQKALELADRLQQDFNSEYINWDNVLEAAAELRRLSAENEALRFQIFDHQLVLRGWEVRTEWVRTSLEPWECGDHLADVLRARIDALRAQVEALKKDLADANDSAAWHKRRTSLLQSLQSAMQEPERTIVCDVLANGHLLKGPDGLPDKHRYAPQEKNSSQKETGPGFGIEPEELNALKDESLKPEEIAGPADVQHKRVRELVCWFARLARGDANPKWTRNHAMELAYYVATEGADRGLDIAAIEQAAYLEGVNIPANERRMLERLGLVATPSPLTRPAVPEGWKELAARVMDALAECQERTNIAYPAHAKCYPQWVSSARHLRWYAEMFRTGRPIGNGAGDRKVLDALAAAPQPEADDLEITNASLQSEVWHLSTLCDEQRQLLADVEKEFGTDAHGIEFEDGDSKLIDRVRAHLAMVAAPQPPVDVAGPVSDACGLVARLDWARRTLRGIADRGRKELGDSYPEVVQVLDAIRSCLDLVEQDAAAPQPEAQPANDFDGCTKSPTGKHSDRWYAGWNCDHCGKGEDEPVAVMWIDEQGNGTLAQPTEAAQPTGGTPT